MRRTFTASRSPELGGKCHTDTPRMQRGHNETIMNRVFRTTIRVTDSVDKPCCLCIREVKVIKRVLEGNVHRPTWDFHVLGCSAREQREYLDPNLNRSRDWTMVMLVFIVLRETIYIKAAYRGEFGILYKYM